MPGNRVVALGEQVNVSRRERLPGVQTLTYASAAATSPATHTYLREYEGAVRRGQQVARSLVALRAGGFVPDVVCAHPGWGEALFVKEVFPATPLLGYCEFFYRALGADVGFDPEYPATLDQRCRVRVKNSALLLSLEAADAGMAPTAWQRRQFPAELQSRITVLHDGIDTGRVCQDANARLRLPDGRELTRADEVITFVARNLEPYRGFHVFLRMLPALLARRRAARVVIVGGDEVSYGVPAPEGKTYRQWLLAQLGDALDVSRLHFLGRVAYADFLSVLRVSSVHVYLTYPFVLSWSMLEAMAAGCLVIGSRTAPVQEVIEDGVNGWLCDFFDQAGWVDRIADALAAGAKLDPVRAAARQTILERYDLSRICLPGQLALVQSLA